MPNVIDDPATVREIYHQRDALSTYPMTTPLPTPRRRRTLLANFLQTFVAACTRRRPLESRWIKPDLRTETPVDILARKHTYLYIRSLSG